MKAKFSKTIMLCFNLFIFSNAFGQNYSEQAKSYFGNYLDSRSISNLYMKSLPSLEDCKLVFTDQNADIYFNYVEGIRSKLQDLQQVEFTKFIAVRVESFTTSDILNGYSNFDGGMKNIVDKIQPNVVFYKIDYLKQRDAEAGVAYKYWLKVNDRWVFFPRPYAAFGRTSSLNSIPPKLPQKWEGFYSYQLTGQGEYKLTIRNNNTCIYEGVGQQLFFKIACIGKENENNYEVYYEKTLDGAYYPSSWIDKHKPIITLLNRKEKLFTDEGQIDVDNKGPQILFKKSQ